MRRVVHPYQPEYPDGAGRLSLWDAEGNPVSGRVALFGQRQDLHVLRGDPVTEAHATDERARRRR